MFVNDIIVNVSHKHYLFCYDWSKKDQYLNLKQVPLVYIDKQTFHQIINYETKVNEDFINRVKNKALLYGDKNYIYLNNICVLTDGLKAMAIIVDDKYKIIRRSSLLFDEEQEVVSFTVIMNQEKFDFKFGKAFDYNILLTKQENILYKKIKKNIGKKNLDQLRYWYYLIYNKVEYDQNKLINEFKKPRQIMRLLKLLSC